MTKKTWLKIGIVLVIMGMGYFSDFGFAADAGMSGDDEGIWTIGFLLNLFISILSWIWVLFANLAGEFLSNKWVYGEIIGLDVLLRKRRIIVRNIANFGLGFYFVYMIFSSLIGGKDVMGEIKKSLLWILVAGVGIQASRFITAAMIDVSTITMVAAGSLSEQVTSLDPRIEVDIHASLSDFVDQNFVVTSGKIYTLFPENRRYGAYLEEISVPIVQIGDKPARENIIDMILPSSDDISSSLHYIGFAILNTNKIISGTDFSSLKGLKRTILNTIIVGGSTIVYSIEMLVLCILALMRILYLWMFIVLSPLAILFGCIGKANEKIWNKIGGDKGFLSAITKQINIKSFLINIFKPTIIVLGMGIALMFSVLMMGLINESGNTVDKDLGGIHVTSQMNGSGTYDTTFSSDFFKYSLGNTVKSLLEMIISIITVILIYFVIKIAVGMGKRDDFVSKNIKSLQSNVETAITSVPIIPVSGYDENGAESTAALSRDSLKSFPSEKLGIMSRKYNYESNQTDEVLKGWGLIGNKDLTQTQMEEISNIRKNNPTKALEILTMQKEKINTFSNGNKNLESGEGYGMTLAPNASNKFWQEEFIKWLDFMSEDGRVERIDSENLVWKNMITRWKGAEDKNKTLENLFKGGNGYTQAQAVKAYADLFGLGDITTWNELIQKDISEKK